MRERVTAFWIIVAVAASAVMLAGVAVAPHGPGLSPDSIEYVIGGRSLAAGAGYDAPSFAPLYSWLLSLPLRVGVPVEIAGCVVNFASFFGTILIVGQWILRDTGSARLATAAAALVALSPPLFLTSVYIRSESPFIFLAIASAHLLNRRLGGAGIKNLVGAALLMGLALLTKYSGVLLVAAYAALLTVSGDVRKPRHWGTTALFLGISVLPVGLWLALGSGANIVRRSSALDISDAVASFLSTVGDWMFGDLVEPEIGMVLAGAVLFAPFILGIGRLWMWATGRERDSSSATITVAFTGAAGYSIGLCALSAIIAFDEIGNRLAAPVYPFATVAAVAGLDRFLGRRAASRSLSGMTRAISILLWRRAAVTVVFLLWLAVPASQVLDTVLDSRNQGLGLADVAWQRSELGAFLPSWNPEGVLISNQPEVAYWLSGRPFKQAPRMRFFHNVTGPPPKDLPRLLARYRRGAVIYIVWFDRSPAHLMTLEELGRWLTFEPVATFSDGRIMKVSGLR